MSSESECQSQFCIEEFKSEWESTLLYYHVLKMNNSAYVWVGTEAGEQGALIAALSARPGVDTDGVPATSLLRGNCQEMASSSAVRLQSRLKYPILLSLDIPEAPLLLEHVENILLQRLA